MSAAADDGTEAGRDRAEALRAIEAEAAVWIAMLHGPRRTRQVELNCLAWQQRSPVHRAAFERCTEVWELAGGLSPEAVRALAGPESPATSAGTLSGRPSTEPQRAPVARPGPVRPLRRRVAWACAAGLGGLLVLGGGWQAWQARDDLQTAVGEQRSARLEDGTRLWLNTDTRLHVSMTEQRREVRLTHGEAYFEVAKDGRPFAVRAGDREVLALGTAFVVRWEGDAGPAPLVVTLVEGQVQVQPVGPAAAGRPAAIAMRAGDRLRLPRPSSAAVAAAPAIDRPPIERLMAWTRSEVVFDDTPLTDAVAEMNRYSRTPIVLEGGRGAGEPRVSGVFRVGDSEGFVKSVAALRGLDVKQGPGRIELHPRP